MIRKNHRTNSYKNARQNKNQLYDVIDEVDDSDSNNEENEGKRITP